MAFFLGLMSKFPDTLFFYCGFMYFLIKLYYFDFINDLLLNLAEGMDLFCEGMIMVSYLSLIYYILNLRDPSSAIILWGWLESWYYILH